jgi:hypothetical protein
MKKIIYAIFLIISINSVNAQKVFTVEYENQADVKVFVVKYENQADINIFKVKYENQAGDNDGKWFFQIMRIKQRRKFTL